MLWDQSFTGWKQFVNFVNLIERHVHNAGGNLSRDIGDLAKHDYLELDVWRDGNYCTITSKLIDCLIFACNGVVLVLEPLGWKN